MPMEIELTGIHPRVGELNFPIDSGAYPVRPGPGFAPDDFGVLLYWPNEYRKWFRVSANSGSGEFATDPPSLLDALQSNGLMQSVLAQEVLDERWVAKHCFAVGSASTMKPIRLGFAVNTNLESCIRELMKSLEGLPPSIPMTAVFFHKQVPQADYLEIRLDLVPCTPAPKSSRIIGLDLGNTSSTLAAIEPYEIDGDTTRPLTKRIPMLTTRNGNGASDPRGQAVPSELRVLKLHTWIDEGQEEPGRNRAYPDAERFPEDDLPGSIEFLVGEIVRNPNVPARSVILGAKRLGSARPKKKPAPNAPVRFRTHSVQAPHRMHRTGAESDEQHATLEFDSRVPLELLASRLLHHYREAHRAWPARIALTYPTTYTRYELQALRRAVQKGWLRMQAAGQKPGRKVPDHDPELTSSCRELQRVVAGSLDLATQSHDPVVRLLLDEASAAAFFFLYRRIFEESTGGLAAFRYLYEDRGLNMLLYDCGGGTTDIALVNATAEPGLDRLRLTVLRRSGDRTFGGDDITRQLCRLFKAKLQYAIASNRGRGGQLPETPLPPSRRPEKKEDWLKLGRSLEQFIEAMTAFDPQDALVPTRTPHNQPATEERRAAALALWRLGEQLKIQLSGETMVNGVAVPTMEAKWPATLEQRSNKLTEVLLAGDAAQVAKMKRALEGVSVARAELDALVYEPMMKGIRNCNKLIKDVFDSRFASGAAPAEVQWVVASGNAVRYPFLRECLVRKLAVPFLEDDPQRFTFDPVNAKDATAKGAMLALATMEGAAIDICFDSGLADRLPFTVGCQTPSVGGVTRLFDEHTRYVELKDREPVRIPVAELRSTEQHRFLLQRSFPGDGGFHNFLAFEFPEGIRGTHLQVSYDDSTEYEFRVVDGSGAEGVADDLTAGEIYVAPAQRGDI